MTQRGWSELDILLVSGDAYVDHPAFGAAAIGRLLEARGYRVGLLDVPDLEPDGSGWKRLPAPRLFVGVTAGTIDSMVTNYTASKRRRRVDVYRPGGIPGRPNRATIAYTALARHHFPGLPVVIGGLEAGPRRLAHYDYWQDGIRRSILVDAKADLLVWGMGERQSLEVAQRIQEGRGLCGLAGTCEMLREDELSPLARAVPSFDEIQGDPDLLIELFHAVREENHPGARPLAQRHGERYLVQYPPLPPSTQAEVDSYYDLPFRREVHPDHAAAGVPALEPVRWSINTHRGCMADCTFCSITFHQGRTIQGRSEESILREAATLAELHDFRGTITDVGGPTANMYGLGCKLLEKGNPCLGRDCLTPDPCPALRIDKTSEGYRRLLALVRGTAGVKHVHVSSGIRHDLLRGKKGELLPLHHDLVRHHVPGRMKLAPEHASPNTLRAMNKPSFDVYEAYEKDYKRECADLGRDQHLVNYFIVGHPGTTLEDALHLFEKLLERNYSPEQVQEFIPLPMTRACVQYVTGRDPITREELYVPRGERERKQQKALVRWKAPDARRLVEEALQTAGRADLFPRFRQLAQAAQKRARPAGRKVKARSAASEASLDLDTCG